MDGWRVEVASVATLVPRGSVRPQFRRRSSPAANKWAGCSSNTTARRRNRSPPVAPRSINWPVSANQERLPALAASTPFCRKMPGQGRAVLSVREPVTGSAISQSVYGANHKSEGLPTGFRHSSSQLKSARMATEDSGTVGASWLRTRLAISCTGDSHRGAYAKRRTGVGLSNRLQLRVVRRSISTASRPPFASAE